MTQVGEAVWGDQKQWIWVLLLPLKVTHETSFTIPDGIYGSMSKASLRLAGRFLPVPPVPTSPDHSPPPTRAYPPSPTAHYFLSVRLCSHLFSGLHAFRQLICLTNHRYHPQSSGRTVLSIPRAPASFCSLREALLLCGLLPPPAALSAHRGLWLWLVDLCTWPWVTLVKVQVTPYNTALLQHSFTLTLFENWEKPSYNMAS